MILILHLTRRWVLHEELHSRAKSLNQNVCCPSQKCYWGRLKWSLFFFFDRQVIFSESCGDWSQQFQILLCVKLRPGFQMVGWIWKAGQGAVLDGTREQTRHHFHWRGRLTLRLQVQLIYLLSTNLFGSLWFGTNESDLIRWLFRPLYICVPPITTKGEGLYVGLYFLILRAFAFE